MNRPGILVNGRTSEWKEKYETRGGFEEYVSLTGSNNCHLDRRGKHRELFREGEERERRGENVKVPEKRKCRRETLDSYRVPMLPSTFSPKFAPRRRLGVAESANSILPETSTHLHSLFRLLIPGS